jgi:hypothetical protein
MLSTNQIKVNALSSQMVRFRSAAPKMTARKTAEVSGVMTLSCSS